MSLGLKPTYEKNLTHPNEMKPAVKFGMVDNSDFYTVLLRAS